MKIFLRVAAVLLIGALGLVTVQAVISNNGASVAADSGKDGAEAPSGPDAGAGEAGGKAGDETTDAGDGASEADADNEAASPDAPASGPLETDRPPAGESEAEEGGDPFTAEAKAAILFVNKQHPLDADFVPDDLVVPNVKFSFDGDDPKKQLQREAAEALERLFAAAEEDGIELRAVSGYRSYARQKAIFEYNASIKGEEEANRTSAYPGQSEHQTGLAMDVSAASVNYALEETLGDTVEGIWLAEHAADHGFIIRYPKEKEDITGYKYEPWHLRYVGEDVADYVTKQDLTLEEFLLGE